MDLLTAARARCKHRDLVVLLLVERFRHDQEYRSNALSIAAHIKGAPIVDVQRVLDRLADEVKVLERYNEHDFRVTPLGAEVLSAEVAGWEPSSTEQIRRDMTLRSAQI